MLQFLNDNDNKMLEVARTYGTQAIVAGGYLRDQMWGKTPHDCDIFVSSPQRAEPQIQVLRRTLTDAFGPVNLKHKGRQYMCPARAARETVRTRDLVCVFEVEINGGLNTPYQLIFYDGTPNDIVNDFDFGVNKIWHDGSSVYTTEHFNYDFVSDQLTCRIPNWPEVDNRLRRRAYRIAKKLNVRCDGIYDPSEHDRVEQLLQLMAVVNDGLGFEAEVQEVPF